MNEYTKNLVCTIRSVASLLGPIDKPSSYSSYPANELKLQINDEHALDSLAEAFGGNVSRFVSFAQGACPVVYPCLRIQVGKLTVAVSAASRKPTAREIADEMDRIESSIGACR